MTQSMFLQTNNVLVCVCVCVTVSLFIHQQTLWLLVYGDHCKLCSYISMNMKLQHHCEVMISFEYSPRRMIPRSHVGYIENYPVSCFVVDAIYQIELKTICSRFLYSFYHERVWPFLNAFSESIEMIM